MVGALYLIQPENQTSIMLDTLNGVHMYGPLVSLSIAVLQADSVEREERLGSSLIITDHFLYLAGLPILIEI